MGHGGRRHNHFDGNGKIWAAGKMADVRGRAIRANHFDGLPSFTQPAAGPQMNLKRRA